MTTATAEQLYCGNCSDPVESLDEHGYGRCCHNLPAPWYRGSDGLYTSTSGSDDPDDEDGVDDDVRPRCAYCGGMRFVIHAHQWRRHSMSHTVHSSENELDDSTLWYDRDDFKTVETDEADDFNIEEITCAHCDQEVSGRFDVEES